jgi:hypothetical protein
VILHALALVHGGGEKRSRVDLMQRRRGDLRSPETWTSSDAAAKPMAALILGTTPS